MKELNKNLSFDENFDAAIEELAERDEFSCTGNGCAGAACGAKDVEL